MNLRERPMPGDGFLGPDAQSLDHAITLAAPPSAVWPWLAQMGAGNRGGWYSYDFLDNGRRPSARHLHPEWQRLEVGMIFPAAPGATDGFELLAFDVERYLILGGRADGRLMVTWAFELEPVGNGATRLRVRARGAPGYRLFNVVPPALSRLLVRVVHGIMQRKQLHEIARRVA
ncbi:MAG: SRPBCC family protein [Vicinamibacterales bacterium]